MQNRIRKTLPLVAVTAMLGLMSTSLGCAFGEIYWTDPLKREFSLSEIQKRYTNLVRFGAFQQATRYVDPALIDTFLENFPAPTELVFTDFDSGRIQFDESTGRKDAVVKVNYSAYYTHGAVLFNIVETQSWYRTGPTNSWKVRPSFEGLEKLAAAN